MAVVTLQFSNQSYQTAWDAAQHSGATIPVYYDDGATLAFVVGTTLYSTDNSGTLSGTLTRQDSGFILQML